MWCIFAIATSICYACYYLCNQHSKLNPNIFIVYRGFIPALAVLPALLWFAPQFAWPFFAIAVIQGIAVSYLDYNIYKLFQKFGAEMISSIQPLAVLITFIFWLVVKPAILTSYMADIGRFAAIILAVLSIVLAVMKYRQQALAVSCLKSMLPLLLIFSFIDVTNKIIMTYANGHLLAATVYRVLIVSLIVGFVNLGICYRRHISVAQLFKKENLLAAWFLLLAPLNMILVNFSVHYAENPAYTSAMTYLSVIWIMLFNKIGQHFGFKQKYQPIAKRWIILLLAATAVLIIATAK
ncbi:MAG: hypothetical protein J6Y91_04400 [Alphaproteobacteria bacterium]|nr:hypothetical protein [Alphaproteobacteria bacterium]